MNIELQLKKDLSSVLSKLGFEASEIKIESPKDTKFGDYSTNIAMVISKKEGKSPMEVAEKIVEAVNGKGFAYLDKASLAPPGFINFNLSAQALGETLKRLLNSEIKADKTGQTAIVEYTDPNPFKEMHIGHLYSNIVGESTARILQFQGNEVKRLCYQGDIGLHVAKAIYGIQKKLSEANLSLEELESKSLPERMSFLGESYALGASEYEDVPEAKETINSLNKRIYERAPEILPYYQKGRQWSLEEFDQIYAKLGTKFDKFYFESEVAEAGVNIVRDHLKDGVFEESESAIIFDGEKYGLHKRVFINSLGLPTYEAKELALAEQKARDFSFDLSIIVTAKEVSDYFKVLFKVITLIHPEFDGKIKHIGHGFVKLPEGKMSSRSGNVLTAEWLMDEAVKKVKSEFSDMDEKTAEEVGIGAIKYSLLKSGIGKDVVFNFDESISLEGNSGPYLQYTYVRCLSVLGKADKDFSDFEAGAISKEESSLLKKLAKFEGQFIFTKDFSQSDLCTYLYELASVFNLFYQRNPILKSENEDFRLSLTEATSNVLKTGLYLLGIDAPSKM